MNPIPLFNQVKKEFDEKTAIVVSCIYAIHICKKVKKKHLKSGSLFTEELTKLFRDSFYELEESELEFCIEVWDCIYDWTIGQSLGGLGGCEPKTFKELLKEKIQKK